MFLSIFSACGMKASSTAGGLDRRIQGMMPASLG
jgi:hypothetical protein